MLNSTQSENSISRTIDAKRFSLSSLIRSEDGASYSLSLALTTPFYTLMICVLIELTLMMNVQIGVDLAAFAAARSASVWVPAEVTSLNTPQQKYDMIHRAAAHALTPYSSSQEKHQRSDGPLDSQGDADYMRMYRGLADPRASQTETYVLRKRRYALAATRVEFENLNTASSTAPGDRSIEEVRVTVRYEMPFNVPGVGMIFGKRSSSGIGWVRELTSSVIFQIERPQTSDRHLGIEYDSRPAASFGGT
ncbi:MAG: hypothetical protein JNL58_17135 [Planctomyces sp.]|nr:hypothetical protein [Planctomyces sp.]